MYYHLTYFADGCIEVLSMPKLDNRLIKLYERCVRSNNRLIFEGKMVDCQGFKNNVMINSADNIIEHLALLDEDDASEDYQEMKDYIENTYMKEEIVNEVQDKNSTT